MSISDVTASNLNVEVIEGNNLVFDYIHTDEDCPTTIDDERGARIQFELDPSLNAITLNDEELGSINCIDHRSSA